jgi:putative aldouronate transport system substrate-binding protein
MNRIMKGAAIIAIVACLVSAATAADSKRMKITVANYQMEPTDPNGEMLKFYGDKFGCDFTVVNINHDQYHELLNIKLSAGEIPDLLYLRHADTLGTYVKQGVLAKLSPELIQKNAPDLWKAITVNAKGYMEMGKVNGVQYAIPAVNPTNIFRLPLVYRTDWMKKLGVTKTPETLAEFESLMYKFAKNDPDGDGKADTYGFSKDGLNAVFGAFGVVPFDAETDYWMLENGKVINDTVSSGAKQALAVLAKYYKDGIIDPEFITGENQGGYWALSHAFIKGRIGYSSHGNYYHWQTAGAYQSPQEDGSMVPCPAFANGQELIAATPTATLGFGLPLKGPTGKQGMKQYNRLSNFFCIGKLAESDPAKVAKILQILNVSADPDFVTRNSIHYGPKDKYWKLLDADTESWLNIPPYDKDSGYWSRIGGELWMEVPLPPKGPREQWAYRNNMDKYGIESLIQIGLPKAMKYKAELMKIRDEAYLSIITGDKPASYFDEFVTKYMAAGGAEVQQESNEYYASLK